MAIVPLPGSIDDVDPRPLASLAEQRSHDGSLDVLLGGPPCQGFSLNSHIRSADDPRNHLFRHYVRILRGLAPKFLVLENVPGMLSLAGGAFFQELIASLADSSAPVHYEVRYKILNAAHYGVPQDRFRIVVLGTRADIAGATGPAELPEPRHYSLAQAHFKGGREHTFHAAIGFSHKHKQSESPLFPLLPPVTIREALSDLPRITNGGGKDDRSYATKPAARKAATPYQREMRAGVDRLRHHWCREMLDVNQERVMYIPPGGDWRSIPKRLLPPGMKRALRKDHTTRYGRQDPDSISCTILTKPDPHWGAFIHYDENQHRLISVREAARLQSFPDRHRFGGKQSEQYLLVGNAVPPLLASAVAGNIAQKLWRLRENAWKPRRKPSPVSAAV